MTGLRVWVVYDGDADADDCAPLVVVAETDDRAVDLWYDATGLERFLPAATRQATWDPRYGPEPLHTAEGVWNGEVRGYGVWWDDDPECEECNEHQHPLDAVTLYWPEYDRSGELVQRMALTTCRWCAVDQAEVCSG